MDTNDRCEAAISASMQAIRKEFGPLVEDHHMNVIYIHSSLGALAVGVLDAFLAYYDLETRKGILAKVCERAERNARNLAGATGLLEQMYMAQKEAKS